MNIHTTSVAMTADVAQRLRSHVDRPDGQEDRRIHFPTKKVSSVTFGGSDYSDLYVTTAGGNDPNENGEHAGALFRMNIGVRGVAEWYSRIGPDIFEYSPAKK